MSYVTTGKPATGGAVFFAATTASLPTDATTTLVGFTGLGYVSEDGVTNSDSKGYESIKAWGGDTVHMFASEHSDTFQMTLIEAMDINVLKLVYGAANVSGTLSTGIAIESNASEDGNYAFVIDMIFNGALKRVVIPNGKVTEVGDITYRDSEAVGYEITITAMPDDSGNTHYEYIVEDES